MDVSEAKCLKQLEVENTERKHVLAEVALDNKASDYVAPAVFLEKAA